VRFVSESRNTHKPRAEIQRYFRSMHAREGLSSPDSKHRWSG